jgi:nitrate reductase gamma subunit
MILRIIFGAIIPYAAAIIFLAGVVRQILEWANCPVPFRTPVACGQQKSLPWIKINRLDNPSTAWGAVGRMALEIFLFRSLFRNTKAELQKGPRLVYGESKFLWLAALAFHWSFLFIVLRHLRFFLDPVPAWIISAQELDGFFQIGAPALYATDLIIFAALLYLLLRRIIDSRIRYISLFADYFALFLLAGIAGSGILMRYFFKTDLMEVKRLMQGLAQFTPVVPEGVSVLFFAHLFLLSALVAYFPFSKLMHMGGVFLSPTRNLANNNRSKRHVNPWNYPVKVHSYEEWEEEFRDKIVASGLPLDKG